ncbi:MAG: STAS domain-containing protein [Actinomycetota bacterium]|nr:STAS domain-containing protein [Actinomycetota bacterium]
MVRLGIAEADGRCWVAVEGELDRHSSGWLRDHLVALGQRGCRKVLIDLRRTTVIDSSGLNVLLGAMEGMEELGGELVLQAPPADVYERGRVGRLGELLAIVDQAVEEAEAIERLSTLFASRDLGEPSPDFQTWVFHEAGEIEEPEEVRGPMATRGAGRKLRGEDRARDG